jgi:transposase InsO family protein
MFFQLFQNKSGTWKDGALAIVLIPVAVRALDWNIRHWRFSSGSFHASSPIQSSCFLAGSPARCFTKAGDCTGTGGSERLLVLARHCVGVCLTRFRPRRYEPLRAFVRGRLRRLWRSVKYERIYLFEHGTLPTLRESLEEWFGHYNNWRLHEKLGNLTPAVVYHAIPATPKAA